VAGSDDFSVSDADALLELIYSIPSGRIIIVGRQAVNFWADRYAPDKPELLAYRPFTSRDLDLLGSIADAYQLASKTHSVVYEGQHRLSSPILKSVRGVTNREIDDKAVPFVVGDAKIYMTDPITMLKAKLHKLVELDQ
jgi:hypothetical protein